jgi:hypothetical protein
MAAKRKQPEFIEVLGSSDPGSIVRYNKRAGIIKSTFGDGANDIIATDETVQYLMALLKEKKEEFPNMTFGMSESLTTMAFTDSSMSTPVDSGLHSMEVVSYKITNTYKETIMESGGVYTVLNAGDYEGSNIAHQNWLYLSYDDKTLLRFEPSAEYPQFRINELCDLIVAKMGPEWKWEMAITHRLNTFMGCRAFSTLLAAMYIKGVDFETLEKFKGKSVHTQGRLTKPFVVLMQEEIACKMTSVSRIVIPRSGRIRAGEIPSYKIVMI